jgi:SAM-dependent methyltransferase
VHKKLHFENLKTNDIYDWIVDRIDVPDRGSILDAGCGVGFGTLRLAEHSHCRVTGISLSKNEIASARDASRAAGLADRVEFSQRSFDDLPSASYDLIVAVESLKHSPDLIASLRSLLEALRPGGQLVVVEDLFNAAESASFAQCIVRDWNLARLYEESDYVGPLNAANCRIADLTDEVRVSGRLAIALRLALLAVLIPFAAAGTAAALRAFRGGLYLEKSYARGAMAYKAIFYSSPKQNVS